MSSSVEEFAKHQQELSDYRQEVDQQMQITAQALDQVGFNHLSQQLLSELKPSLQNGRQQVDLYTQIPRPERTAQEMDQAILAMFTAWDSSRKILKGSDCLCYAICPFG